ncbi:MAG: hypothetical protein HZB66_02370 [Candidatus Aenigmarchaeota archaeon]|nr:hypothetical protein [Candidatus Aenigmarchaeota archaeon]
MDAQQITENIDREIIKNIADDISEEIVNKVYFKLLILKFLPEIKAIESRNIVALKNDEIDNFFKKVI